MSIGADSITFRCECMGVCAQPASTFASSECVRTRSRLPGIFMLKHTPRVPYSLVKYVPESKVGQLSSTAPVGLVSQLYKGANNRIHC